MAVRAEEVGRGISRMGLAKRAESWVACWVVGVRARRFVGRLERGSWDVGIDSGMGSDILGVRRGGEVLFSAE